MKNLQDHRKLADELENKYGYTVEKVVKDKLTGESCITMSSAEDSKEMYEIFGEQGYSFGFTLNKTKGKT